MPGDVVGSLLDNLISFKAQIAALEAAGVEGPQGTTGTTGSAGPQGDIGPQGATGPQGA